MTVTRVGIVGAGFMGSGIAQLTALKADPELEHTPVVMVTFVSERGLATALGAAANLARRVACGG